MLFNSYEFLFVFLPIVAIGFHLIHLKSRRVALGWITLGSLVFYAYWDWRYLGLIIPSVTFNWAMGHLIARTRQRAWLVAGITANLALIVWFKYALFLFLTVTAHSVAPPEIIRKVVLPLGISFFTFQQIAYLVNVYRGHQKAASFDTHAFIVLFFPHLIAGPIVLYENIVAQVHRHPRVQAYFLRSAKVGLFLLAIGLMKKVVVADSLAPFVKQIFTFAENAAKNGYELLLPDAILGAAMYSLQLYFDFSGYSDMAIGLALLFGFRLPVNFYSPYKARSIIDFWRRWHMTLSSFFRNYVYIPLGGNRRGIALQLVFILVVFFLTGLWHGAGWTFIAWGVLHGVLVAANHVWANTRVAANLRDSRHAVVRDGYSLACGILTMTAVAALWVVFRAESWQTVAEFGRALGRPKLQGAHPIHDMNAYYVLAIAVPALFVLCWFMPNSIQLGKWARRQIRWADRASASATDFDFVSFRRATLPALLTGLLLYLAVTSIGHVPSEFIYFNF
jgi:D-alanyl-lipoteichoic acid acyltransferase DltB (MBOAT superfamily)